jgi:hypothetical protein
MDYDVSTSSRAGGEYRSKKAFPVFPVIEIKKEIINGGKQYTGVPLVLRTQ